MTTKSVVDIGKEMSAVALLGKSSITLDAGELSMLLMSAAMRGYELAHENTLHSMKKVQS
jgi:hypothetical protein